MATWPASLPQVFDADGQFRYTKRGNLVVTQPEVGPPRARRRSTVEGWDLGGRMLISTAQRTTLEAFYESTLVGGTDSFDWVDPVDGAAAEYQFVADPEYAYAVPGYWFVSLALVQLP